MDPTALTVAFLTSFAGMVLMIPLLTEALKDAIFWGDTPARDHLVPVLAAVVGIAYGTAAAWLGGGDVGGMGLQGLAIAGLASYAYQPVTGPVIGAVQSLLSGQLFRKPPPTPEA